MKLSQDSQRWILASYVITILLTVLILDGAGIINVEKWGYAAIASWLVLILQYYFRKKPSNDK